MSPVCSSARSRLERSEERVDESDGRDRVEIGNGRKGFVLVARGEGRCEREAIGDVRLQADVGDEAVSLHVGKVLQIFRARNEGHFLTQLVLVAEEQARVVERLRLFEARW